MAVTPSNSSLLTPDDDANQLTISNIVDPNNVSIINKITYQTSFKISGINAERNSLVWIMNGNDKLDEATSDSAGEWETRLLDAPKFDCYSVFAEGRWADQPVSPNRRFTVATNTPIINSVHADGEQIEDNDTISATEVTINGSSIPNQDAEAFNGDIPLKTELTNACGVCTFKLEDLAPGPYIITVKAPNGNVSTPPFRFTVIEEGIEPVTLDKITNAAGTVIPDNSTTTETSLFVEGEGEKGAKVEVFKKGETLGEATVDPVTGRYRHPTGLLTDDTYAFTVTAKYTGGGNAGPYTITVEAATTAPTQTRIYDVDGRVIADGGDLNASWFVARGFHTPNSVVKIKLNGVIQPQSELTNAEGRWASLQNELTVGSTYEISALTEDEKAESNKWTVVARAPSKS